MKEYIPNPPIEEVIQTYKSMVYGIALTRERNREDAEDIFQNVFLTYYKKNLMFVSEERRKGWLIRATLNFCQKSARRRRRKGAESLYVIGEQPDRSIPMEFQLEEENMIFDAMGGLPENCRAAVYLFYFEDMSVADISESLGVSQGAVKMRLSRGRNQMREALKGDLNYEPEHT